MRKLIICIIACCALFMFSGCSKNVKLTDDETDQFAEYISGVVLKRDTNYTQALISYDEYVTDTQSTQEEAVKDAAQAVVTETKPSQVTENSETTPLTSPAKSSLKDIFSKYSVNVSYKSSKVYTSYPENASDNYFTIESLDGYKLIVVSLNLKNSSSKNVNLDLIKDNIEYKLMMGEKSYRPLMTLLINDMQFIDISIPGNSSKQGVLVFRVPDNKAKAEKQLVVTKGSKVATLDLQ